MEAFYGGNQANVKALLLVCFCYSDGANTCPFGGSDSWRCGG